MSIRAPTVLLLALASLGACTSSGKNGDTDVSVDTDAVDTDVVDTDPTSITLDGALAKGPFVLGSTLDVATVDELGNPLGEVFPTTTDDLGSFQVAFAWRGLVSLKASGFFYNEVTGALSGAPIDLRGLTVVDDAGEQHAYVNLITHLCYPRVLALLAQGASFDDAVTQAEGELRAAVGLPTVGLDTTHGIDTNLLSGDTPATAYLFALSTVVAEAAQHAGDSPDAQLQELLNTLANDLADDGQISDTLRTTLDAAQAAVDAGDVEAKLAQRLADLGSAATVPHLDSFLDHDLDGVPDATDLCPTVQDPDQLDTDLDGIGDACDCGNGLVDPGEVCDDQNDIDGDACESDCTLPVCGNGIRDDSEVCFGTGWLPSNAGARVLGVADLNDDGHLDLVSAGELGVGVRLGAGDGTFSAEALVNLPLNGPPSHLVLADKESDGDLDLFLLDGLDGRVFVLTQDGAGSFTLDTTVAIDSAAAPSDLTVGDLDADGLADLVVSQLFGDRFDLLLGDGTLGYLAATALTIDTLTLDQPLNVRLAHMDGDDTLDLVAVSLTAEGLRAIVAGGLDDGSFGTPTLRAVSAQAEDLAVVDLDQDGDLDVVATQNGLPALSVLLGDGDGGLGAASDVTIGANAASCDAYHIDVAPLDADGVPDVVAACGGPSSSVRVASGNGAAFPDTFYDLPGMSAQDVGAGDLNEDGVPDLVYLTAGGTVIGLGDAW